MGTPPSLMSGGPIAGTSRLLRGGGVTTRLSWELRGAADKKSSRGKLHPRTGTITFCELCLVSMHFLFLFSQAVNSEYVRFHHPVGPDKDRPN